VRPTPVSTAVSTIPFLCSAMDYLMCVSFRSCEIFRNKGATESG
jgi:hypothetical protein